MVESKCVPSSSLFIYSHRSSQVCLFGPPVLNLRPLLRATTDDLEILPKIGEIVQGKKFAHDGLGGASGIKANGKSGPMVSIGG